MPPPPSLPPPMPPMPPPPPPPPRFPTFPPAMIRREGARGRRGDGERGRMRPPDQCSGHDARRSRRARIRRIASRRRGERESATRAWMRKSAAHFRPVHTRNLDTRPLLRAPLPCMVRRQCASRRPPPTRRAGILFGVRNTHARPLNFEPARRESGACVS